MPIATDDAGEVFKWSNVSTLERLEAYECNKRVCAAYSRGVCLATVRDVPCKILLRSVQQIVQEYTFQGDMAQPGTTHHAQPVF
jgi:hypothetical protein